MVKADRCPWADGDPLYARYHDSEWGVPCRNSRDLFELLILEGMQAGLSWITILKKRRHMRQVFLDFDPERLGQLEDGDIESLLQDPGIIRHRGKVTALRSNAQAYLSLQAECAPEDYFWSWLEGAPLQNSWASTSDVPTTTEAAKSLSKDLKKRGFKFVGPTICYAFMQSGGMVNDHIVTCFRYAECAAEGARREIVD